jgi:capsular polysaccharide biosynthesis protein
MNKALNANNEDSEIRDQINNLRDDLLRIERLLRSNNELLGLITTSLKKLAAPELASGYANSISVWKPLSKDLSIPKSILTHKIHRISSIGNKTTFLEALKKSSFGIFYKTKLKNNALCRNFINWGYRIAYRISIGYQQYFINRRWYRLIKFNDYLSATHVQVVKIFDAQTVTIPEVKACSVDLEVSHNFESFDYKFPSVHVAKIEEGVVRGGTNLILVKDQVLFHDLYDYQADYSSEELHGRHLIDLNKMRIKLSSFNSATDVIPIAACFLDACAHNYAHWITEILSRVAAFCSLEDFQHVPIIVDDRLHLNLMASLRIIAGENREIILLPIGMQLSVKVLCVTSVAGYVPFEPRNKDIKPKNQGLFSSAALSFIHNSAIKAIEHKSNDLYPKKIYLRRNSGARLLVNSDEIEKYLVENGFSIIEPENLTFLEQVKIFTQAQIVLGAGGAAYANAIFLNEGAKVGVMIADNEDMLFRYWPAIFNCFQKLDAWYILGLIEPNSEHLGVHSNFYIPLECVIKFINEK